MEFFPIKVKRAGCNKRAGLNLSPKKVKQAGCNKRAGWNLSQKN